MKMKLTLLSPEKTFFDGEISNICVNTADGQADFYPQHLNFTAYLLPGMIVFYDLTGKAHALYTPGGYLTVKNDHVTVLGDDFKEKKSVSKETVLKEAADIQEKLNAQSPDDVEKIELLGQKHAACVNLAHYAL